MFFMRTWGYWDHNGHHARATQEAREIDISSLSSGGRWEHGQIQDTSAAIWDFSLDDRQNNDLLKDVQIWIPEPLHMLLNGKGELRLLVSWLEGKMILNYA
jgi:hypothetical protein